MQRFAGVAIFILVVLFGLMIAPNILEEYQLQQRAVKYDYVNYDNVDTGDAPLTLEDFGETIQQYRYFNVKESGKIGYRYCDSTNTGLKDMQEAVTLDYGIWYGTEGQLDNQMMVLLKRGLYSDGKTGVTEYDYGASVSQWTEGKLILRYHDCIICFYETTTTSIIDNENAAEFLKNKYVAQ